MMQASSSRNLEYFDVADNNNISKFVRFDQLGINCVVILSFLLTRYQKAPAPQTPHSSYG